MQNVNVKPHVVIRIPEQLADGLEHFGRFVGIGFGHLIVAQFAPKFGQQSVVFVHEGVEVNREDVAGLGLGHRTGVAAFGVDEPAAGEIPPGFGRGHHVKVKFGPLTSALEQRFGDLDVLDVGLGSGPAFAIGPEPEHFVFDSVGPLVKGESISMTKTIWQLQCSPDLTNSVLTNHPGLTNWFLT